MTHRSVCEACVFVHTQAKAEVKWAAAADLKQEVDRQIAALLGPKTEADMQKPDVKKKKAKVSRMPPSSVLHCRGCTNGIQETASQQMHVAHTLSTPQCKYVCWSADWTELRPPAADDPTPQLPASCGCKTCGVRHASKF